MKHYLVTIINPITGFYINTKLDESNINYYINIKLNMDYKFNIGIADNGLHYSIIMYKDTTNEG